MARLTFTANYADSSGGGLYNYTVSPDIDHSTFANNSCGTDGGAIGNSRSTAIFTDCIIENNTTARSGAGVDNWIQGDVTFMRTVFRGNTTTDGHGAGVHNYNSHDTFIDVVFIGNKANGGGGAINNYGGNDTLKNVLMAGNYATGSGAGAWYELESRADWTNVTVVGNYAAWSCSAIYANGFDIVVNNSIIWGNWSQEQFGPRFICGSIYTFKNSITEQCNASGAGWNTVCGVDGGGNLAVDPKFASPVSYESAPTTAGDYSLRFGSPAIDAGDNASVTEVTDLAGGVRRIDDPAKVDTGLGEIPIVDIGAYEYVGVAPDLVVTKTNNEGGNVPIDVTFGWSLLVKNVGTGPASYTNGQVLLVDDLPSNSGVVYGTPQVTDVGSVTGVISCSIAQYKLSCIAAGPVALPVGSQFTVTFNVVLGEPAYLVNPGPGGICRVDPEDRAFESLENNNSCSDTVAVGGVNISGHINDTPDHEVEVAPIGSMVYGVAVVEDADSGPAPVGQREPSDVLQRLVHRGP